MTISMTQRLGVNPRTRVVVVDDDASSLRAMGRLLRTAGFSVALFGSPREFLAALPGLSPQVLVLDVHMPEMTGIELQEHLIDCGIRLPVIFVTAYDTPQTRERARKVSSMELILKPFDRDDLLQALTTLVGA